MRNPPWTRDELILALDTYLRIQPRTPGPSLPEVVELSALLKGIGARRYPHAEVNFRSPASVVMKLMNFRSLDPDYPGKGLEAASQADREAWAQLATDRARIAALATPSKPVTQAWASWVSMDRTPTARKRPRAKFSRVCIEPANEAKRLLKVKSEKYCSRRADYAARCVPSISRRPTASVVAALLNATIPSRCTH